MHLWKWALVLLIQGGAMDASLAETSSGIVIGPEPRTEIRTKPGSAHAVTEFRPVSTGIQVINVVPNGQPSPLGFYGYAWTHWLDADYSTTQNFGAAQVGINETDVVFGSIGFGTQAPKPITVRFDNEVALKVTPYQLEVDVGRIVTRRSNTGVVWQIERNGKIAGRVIADGKGVRLEGFSQIDDLLRRVQALENAQ